MECFGFLDGFSSVSIIGMCKNAGKTTALCGLIRESAKDTRTLGLTSIGRDGESTDVVTSTPKPRIYVYAGTIIATAADMLAICDITREILETTGIMTPMGEVAVARALSDGFVQLAGPSTVDGLMRVSNIMRRHGAQRVIIDGALSRKSLSTPELCQAVVLCTGASYSEDMRRVVQDTAYAARILSLPKTACPVPDTEALKAQDAKYMLMEQGSGFMPVPSDELVKTLRNKRNSPALFIRGAVTDAAVSPVLDSGIKGLELIIENSSKLLISRGMYEKLAARNIVLRVVLPTRLAAITLNPFSAYGLSFDAREFHSSLVREVGMAGLPIINVVSGEVLSC